jgi:hypothetical protein
MGKFNEYTQKATPADNDTLMIYDATSKANKLSPFSGIWNWIVEKLTNAVISNLQTNNKTVVGALNELNSKTLSALRQVDGNVEDWNNIASPGIYSGNGSTSKNTPIEDAIWINAFVVPSNGNLKYLTAYAITDKGIFFRSMNNGRWEAWLQIK